MTRKEHRERSGRRAVKFHGVRTLIGIEELKVYYFAHGGDHGSGNKFNKSVEKKVEYC